mmetsp:Transcript_3917/g.9837  ORF Transcript_3917/g.9837 Transcript_3917/m.9837 type:complete len:101 (+) Transcript_3917:1354-1656(+)
MSKDFDLPEDAPRIDVRFLGVDPDSKLATCEFFGLDKPKIVRRGYSTPGRATQAAVFLYMTLGLPSDDDTVNKWLEAHSFPPPRERARGRHTRQGHPHQR